MTERKHRFYLILLFLFYFAGLIIPSNAEDSDHFFCGSTWADASENVRHITFVLILVSSHSSPQILSLYSPFFSKQCDDREHCPGGSDDDCSTEGSICFGGTTCDSKKGHGNKFKYANVAYDDISNTRFCGPGWTEAGKTCSIETHCPSGFSEECPKGQSCYGGLAGCNVQDMVAKEGEQGETSNVAALNAIPEHDERRNMFCGTSWADASGKCSLWSVSYLSPLNFMYSCSF